MTAQPMRALPLLLASRIRRTLGPFVILALFTLSAATLAGAQQWEDDRPRRGVVREELAPSPGSEERARGVVREELDPVMAADGSGLPYELWGGLSAEQFAQHIANLSLPPKSPALHALWRRLIASDTGPGAGSLSAARFTALRVESLDQSGLIDDAAAVLADDAAAGTDPVLAALTARSEIGLGNIERGCEIARGLLPVQSQLPKPMLSDTILINGYCAAARGDSDGASLQANLLREQDLPGLVGADFLDSASAGQVPEIPSGLKLSLLDYRIATLRGAPNAAKLLAAASPALLAGVAQDPRTGADLRLAAGEAAVAINAIPPGDLAPLYRASGAGGDASTIERAGLFKMAESEQSPLRKTRHIRAYLDEARRAGLYWPALQLMARPTQDLDPVPEIGWFAETAIEINLAAGNYEGARQWARLGPALGAGDGPGSPPLSHWIALADIVDPSRGQDRGRSLEALTPLAYSGRFDAGLLHRLATVLDALDINVPMPLWELISRAPQPAGGHLPDTGVLSELADASKKKEFGRTVLLVLRTIGPAGAEGAHMIALGDALRALKRAGLDAEARQLALEGLFGAWPRSVSQ